MYALKLCEKCAKKPGTGELCSSCLTNRDTIDSAAREAEGMRAWLDKVGHAIGVIEPERAMPGDILRCAKQWSDARHQAHQDLADERTRVVVLTKARDDLQMAMQDLRALNDCNRKHADDADAEVLSLSAEVDALKREAAYLRAETSGLARVVDALEVVLVRAVKG